MPIYEFHCMQCDTEFEELCFSSRDVNAVICPQCNDSKIERLMSRFAMASSNTSASVTQSSIGRSSCASCSASSCRTCSK